MNWDQYFSLPVSEYQFKSFLNSVCPNNTLDVYKE